MTDTTTCLPRKAAPQDGTTTSPIVAFHEGEREAQRRAGTIGVANELERGIKLGSVHPDIIPFLSHCRIVAVTSVDNEGNVWASSFYAQEGLLTVHDSFSVVALHLAKQNFQESKEGEVGPTLGYGLSARIAQGDPISLLPFEPETRGRYRINGKVKQVERDLENVHVFIEVVTSLHNCPKYINKRTAQPTTGVESVIKYNIQQSDSLSEEQGQLITNADILFLGTFSPAHGTDINHRGGQPGFVRVLRPDADHKSTRIMWPEFRGNGMMQSSGNIVLNPHVGVVFIDFTSPSPSHLHLTGTAEIDWDNNLNLEGDRVMIFTLQQAVHVTQQPQQQQGTTPFPTFKLLDISPYNPKVRRGEEGSSAALSGGDSLFPVEVDLVRIIVESPVIKTFRFLSPKKLAWKPGQYATLSFEAKRINPAIKEDTIIRTWTISETPNSTRGDFSFEISVKRKEGGLISTWLHSLDPAEKLTATLLGMDGDFSPFPAVSDQGKEDNEKEKETTTTPTTPTTPTTTLGWLRPAAGLPPSRMLFLSAGVGITPLMAMLRGVRAASLGEEPDIAFLHSERFIDDLPFNAELKRRAATDPNLSFHLFLTATEKKADEKEQEKAEGWVAATKQKATLRWGRLDVKMLREVVPDLKERVAFVCGPEVFIDTAKDWLVKEGVPLDAIRSEHFYF